MDGLLNKLTEANPALILGNIYAGSMAHADDVRSLTCDPSPSERQTMVIEKFLRENFLKLSRDNARFSFTLVETLLQTSGCLRWTFCQPEELLKPV